MAYLLRDNRGLPRPFGADRQSGLLTAAGAQVRNYRASGGWPSRMADGPRKAARRHSHTTAITNAKTKEVTIEGIGLKPLVNVFRATSPGYSRLAKDKYASIRLPCGSHRRAALGTGQRCTSALSTVGCRCSRSSFSCRRGRVGQRHMPRLRRNVSSNVVLPLPNHSTVCVMKEPSNEKKTTKRLRTGWPRIKESEPALNDRIVMATDVDAWADQHLTIWGEARGVHG